MLVFNVPGCRAVVDEGRSEVNVSCRLFSSLPFARYHITEATLNYVIVYDPFLCPRPAVNYVYMPHLMN